jgi:hypothetical protein
MSYKLLKEDNLSLGKMRVTVLDISKLPVVNPTTQASSLGL